MCSNLTFIAVTRLIRIYTAFIFILLSSYESNGQVYLWATTSAGTLDEKATSVKADLQNNVITAGTFQGVVDFDPGPGYYSLDAQASNDIFITKCTPSGKLIWAKTFGAGDPSMALDDKDNIYLTGVFEDQVDFDPGLNTFFLNAQGGDVFVVKLDMHGNFQWAKSFGSPNAFTTDRGYAIEIDVSGNVLVGGVFSGKTDFDPGPGVYELNAPQGDDGFILKLTSNGDFIWARAIIATGVANIRGIRADQDGNVYTSGLFDKTAEFDPGAGVYNITSRFGPDAFLAKFDSSGSFQWAKSFGSKNYEDNQALTLDPQGQIYMEVGFYDTLYIDPLNGSNQLVSPGGYHIAILQYNSGGELGG